MTVQVPETPSVTETPPVTETPSVTETSPVTETPVTEAVSNVAGACDTEFLPGILTSTIRQFIGTPSCGYEYLEYAFAGAVLIILFTFVASFFMAFSKMFGAK